MSHYNSKEKDSYGEDVFIKELIPHIDKTYRTLASRSSRGLEGFSQGGRGATRYMFKYPEMFSTVAAGGASYEIEKLIQQNNGFEEAVSSKINFFNLGPKSNWKNMVDEKLIHEIEKNFEKEMKELNYLS